MTTAPFRVLEVSGDASEKVEAMGTKEKFWFHDPDLGPLLFKFSRTETGEHWAEKLAAEIADCAGIPHARYELARCAGRPGVVSVPFLDARDRREFLIHGNEILSARDGSYPTGSDAPKFGVSRHTVDAVFSAIGGETIALPREWQPLDGVSTASEVFVGYLLLDALVGNTDRHHENWGYVECANDSGLRARHLAPTYDHASSLGRELSDDERVRRLATKDRGYSVEAYATRSRARSALYQRPEDIEPLTMLGAFVAAGQRYRDAARAWIGSPRAKRRNSSASSRTLA